MSLKLVFHLSTLRLDFNSFQVSFFKFLFIYLFSGRSHLYLFFQIAQAVQENQAFDAGRQGHLQLQEGGKGGERDGAQRLGCSFWAETGIPAVTRRPIPPKKPKTFQLFHAQEGNRQVGRMFLSLSKDSPC